MELLHPWNKWDQLPHEWTDLCFERDVKRSEFLKHYLDHALSKKEEEYATFFKYAPVSFLKSIPELKEERREEKTVLVFDTETTGTSKSDVIIQLGFVWSTWDGSCIYNYSELLYTDQPIKPHAFQIHHISQERVRSQGKHMERELHAFVDLCEHIVNTGGVIVAHNAAFDMRLLKQTLIGRSINFPCFCTMKTAKTRQKKMTSPLPNVKNSTLYEYFGGLPFRDEELHDALVDAQITSYVFFKGRENDWW